MEKARDGTGEIVPDREGRTESAAATIADVGEFGLISRMTRGLPAPAHVLLGPGDDAAVVAAPDRRVVATTDLLIEGRHFRLDWSTPEDVGHKAAAQNLADVAAMGARPTALLVGFGAPPWLPVSVADELMRGFAAECREAGAAVVGGDVVSSEAIVLAVTALGDLGGRAPVTRSGARTGDAVVLVGRVGWAAAGLALLLAGQPGEQPQLVAAHRRPHPPYLAGPALAALGATAMCDVSDGLVQDLGHLAERSGVSIVLDTSLIPLPPVRDRSHALRCALGGGDDHALVATVPADADPAALASVRAVRIGHVQEGAAQVLDEAGRRIAVEGWDHYR